MKAWGTPTSSGNFSALGVTRVIETLRYRLLVENELSEQILYFWTLSIALFLFQNSVSETESRLGNVVSPDINTIFLFMYHHHRLLEMFLV
jgi:hypothetical protein